MTTPLEIFENSVQKKIDEQKSPSDDIGGDLWITDYEKFKEEMQSAIMVKILVPNIVPSRINYHSVGRTRLTISRMYSKKIRNYGFILKKETFCYLANRVHI